MIVLRSADLPEKDVPPLLASLDEDFLPDVDLERGTLTYTVVVGEVVGNFEGTDASESKGDEKAGK